jgi:hypothetical protein
MINDQSIPVMKKIADPGHSLYEAERVAAAIVLRVVLLCALAGSRIRHPGSRDEPEEMSGSPVVLFPGTGSAIGCGIFPVTAGTAYGFARSPPDTR